MNAIESVFGFTISYLKKKHLLIMSRLEFDSNHNALFDHLITVQTITEKMLFVSSDRKFEHYRKQKLNFIYNKR